MPLTEQTKTSRPRRRATDTLPEAELAGVDANAPEMLRRQIEKGLPFLSWNRLQDASGLTASQLANVVQMNARTVTRRKQANRLTPEESDRLMRLSRILALTIELFEGDTQAARDWLATPRPALGGDSPLQLVRTEVGAREVERLIDRLEDGVFS